MASTGAVVIGNPCHQTAVCGAVHVGAGRRQGVAFSADMADTTITGILGRIVTTDDGMDRVGTRVATVWHISNDERRVAMTIVTGGTAGRHEATDRLIVIVTGLAVDALVVRAGPRLVVMSGCGVTCGADRLQV